MTNKPLFDTNRAVSWSMISSFEYDKEEWYKKYVLGIQVIPNKEMLFGKDFATSIEMGTCKVPGLLDVLQLKKEHPFQVMFGKIKLVGFADAFDEVKTGKRVWDQKRADEHRQIDMYLLMNLITNKVRPEDVDCTLYWVPTVEKGDFTIDFAQPVSFAPFKTRRTTAQVLKFGSYIQAIHREMQAYALAHA